jgi:hypothetical protein
VALELARGRARRRTVPMHHGQLVTGCF